MAAGLKDQGCTIWHKVALFIKNSVVREFQLAVDPDDLAVTGHRGRIHDPPVDLARVSNDHRKTWPLGRLLNQLV